MIRGKTAFICISSDCNILLNYREFANDKIKNDWLISLQLNYHFKKYFINNKYSKYKQIVRLINFSVEHGITLKTVRMKKHGFLLFFYLIEKLVDQELVDSIKKIINLNHEQVSIDDSSAVFMMLL